MCTLRCLLVSQSHPSPPAYLTYPISPSIPSPDSAELLYKLGEAWCALLASRNSEIIRRLRLISISTWERHCAHDGVCWSLSLRLTPIHLSSFCISLFIYPLCLRRPGASAGLSQFRSHPSPSPCIAFRRQSFAHGLVCAEQKRSCCTCIKHSAQSLGYFLLVPP